MDLPLEVKERILIFASPREIFIICASSRELWYLCSRDLFWVEKFGSSGVPLLEKGNSLASWLRIFAKAEKIAEQAKKALSLLPIVPASILPEKTYAYIPLEGINDTGIFLTPKVKVEDVKRLLSCEKKGLAIYKVRGVHRPLYVYTLLGMDDLTIPSSYKTGLNYYQALDLFCRVFYSGNKAWLVPSPNKATFDTLASGYSPPTRKTLAQHISAYAILFE